MKAYQRICYFEKMCLSKINAPTDKIVLCVDATIPKTVFEDWHFFKREKIKTLNNF